jgi:hypothetical protein
MGVVRQELTSVRLGKPSNDAKAKEKERPGLGFPCVLTFLNTSNATREMKDEKDAPALAIPVGTLFF